MRMRDLYYVKYLIIELRPHPR